MCVSLYASLPMICANDGRIPWAARTHGRTHTHAHNKHTHTHILAYNTFTCAFFVGSHSTNAIEILIAREWNSAGACFRFARRCTCECYVCCLNLKYINELYPITHTLYTHNALNMQPEMLTCGGKPHTNTHTQHTTHMRSTETRPNCIVRVCALLCVRKERRLARVCADRSIWRMCWVHALHPVCLCSHFHCAIGRCTLFVRA